MPDIVVRNLVKRFGGTTVLNDVSFVARDKEFVTLLGPSGCGKTTTLMSIAGFQDPDSGQIACGDREFFDSGQRLNVGPEYRDLGIVFQSYAVWPHLTVAQNVAFPLRVRKVPRARVRDRVAEVLALVEMGGHADKHPHQLSGGQQQRVALARALAASPEVLLLDEPFSNLDAKLRERAREWLSDLQRSLGVTTIFVTHDQDEALSMSDRIVVLEAGEVLQEGTPEEIYRTPTNRSVAKFVGNCNFVSGVARRTGPGCFSLESSDFAPGLPFQCKGDLDGAEVTVAIRPESIELGPPEGPRGWRAAITATSYLGDRYRYRVALGSTELLAQSKLKLAHGPVTLSVAPSDVSPVLDQAPPVVASQEGGGA